MVNKVTKRGRKREMEAGVKKSKLNKPDEFEVAKQPKNKINNCFFDSLLQRNVPHIIEMIFLTLDYDSFKECLDVNATWRNQISSAFLRRNGELLCYKGIFEDERKLLKAADLGLDCHVEIFLDYGMIDVNASDHIGNTSLHFAMRNGDKKVVKILLDRGARSIERLDGEQPLHIAASMGQADLVNIFLDSGADINSAYDWGTTALHLAVSRIQRDVVKVLLNRGADPNRLNKQRKSPLHLAVQNSCKEITKMLLKKGAQLNIENKWGQTPLSLAASQGRIEIYNLFQKNIENSKKMLRKDRESVKTDK